MNPIIPIRIRRPTRNNKGISGKKKRSPNTIKHAKTTAQITFSFISQSPLQTLKIKDLLISLPSPIFASQFILPSKDPDLPLLFVPPFK
jgi:hypothetical protein